MVSMMEMDKTMYVFLVLACLPIVAQGVPKPVAYWALNSEDKLKDSSGNGNHGAATGATLDSNAVGTLKGAYTFAGNANSYIEFPNDGAYDTRYSITLLAYVYPTGHYGPIFNFKRDGWGAHMWQTSSVQHFARFVRRNMQFTTHLPANVLKQNQWNFVGASYNYETGIAKLWKEDEEVYRVNIGKTEIATQYEARMGARIGDGRYFRGMITCMSVYDRELTRQEMLEVMTKCPMKRESETSLPSVNCKSGDLKNKMVEFDGATSKYVKFSGGDIPTLSRFSACWWAKTQVTPNNYRTYFSYMSDSIHTGSIYARGLSNMVLQVNNQGSAGTSLSIQYGLWHHVCVTWSNVVGRYEAYKDGNLAYTNTNLRPGQTVQGGGLLVLGQWLTSKSGSFQSATYSFNGNLASFSFWNKAIYPSDIQAMSTSLCAPEGCGNVMAWTSFKTGDVKLADIETSDLTCEPRVENCKGAEFEGKALHMDQSGSGFSYLQSFQPIQDLTEFTMCSWVRSKDIVSSRYLMMYRSANAGTGSFLLYNPNNVQLYVNSGAATASGMAVNYGLWHHVCVTWKSSDSGRYHYYKDGNLKYTSYNLRSGQTILGGGVLMLGQYQANVGTGLNKAYAFDHEVTEFQLWSEVLDTNLITEMASTPCKASCGDVVSWSYFMSSDMTSSVVVKDADIQCTPPTPKCSGGTFEDKVMTFDSTAEYTYAVLDKEIRDIWSFTSCWWMRTKDTGSTYHTMWTYFAMGDSANVGSIAVENPYTMRVAIKNRWGSHSGVAVNYGMWHHVCLAWTSETGTYHIYRNGGLAYTQTGYSKGTILRGGGKVMLGQRQTKVGEHFQNRAYSYYGDLADFNMWNSLLESDKIQSYVANRGCENGCGNIVSWMDFNNDGLQDVDVEKSDAICEDRASECGKGDFADKKWTLQTTSTEFSYAAVMQEIPTMQAMTVCMWIKSTDKTSSRYLYTYRTSNINTGSMYLYNPNSVQMYIDNQAGAASGVAINYGIWAHVCQTWNQNGGTYRYYKDARQRYASTNLRTNYEIQGGGTFIIGQWQGSIGGTFSTAYGFNAEITKFNLWSEALEASDIEAMVLEPCGHVCGDVVSWFYFRSDDLAAIEVDDHGLVCEKEERVCKKGPFTDKYMSFDSSAEYTYVTAPEDFLDMWAFTACWWMRTNDVSGQDRAMFSYFAPGDNYGSILAQDSANLRGLIKNSWATSSGVSVTYGLWHHVCMTWTTDGGMHEWYKDGSRVFTQQNLRKNEMLRGGGKLVLGQRQTTSTYNRAYSYIGDLSDFHMWSEVLIASSIKEYAENRGCENGCGDLVAWPDITSSDLTEVEVDDAEAVCKERVDCESNKGGEFKGKVLEMDNSGDFAYAQAFQVVPDMSKITMCWWVRSTDTTSSRFLMTYRTSNINTGSIYVNNPNSLRLYVNNGAATASGMAVNYGLWHHVCMTWDSSDSGRYKYYKDGNLRFTSYNLRNGQTILGGGTLFIGTWQASIGGGLNKAYSFNHEVTGFNIWSEVMDQESIADMAAKPCDITCGDAISWPFFRSSDISSAVVVKDSDIPCVAPTPKCSGGAFKDKVMEFDSTAEYTYSVLDKDIRDIWSFTSCWWMRTKVTRSTYNTMWTYFAMGDSANVGSIAVENPYTMKVAIKSQWGSNSGVAVNYGMWHHVCLAWTSESGTYQIYRDGGLAYTQTGYSKGKILRGGGKVMLGQRQTKVGEHFQNRAYSYYGDLADFNMWDNVLETDTIKTFVENRGCANGCGNIVSWMDFTTDSVVDAEIEDADAVCKDRVTECGKGDFDDMKWTLETTSTQFSYAAVKQEIPTMTAMTVCMWIKSSDKSASKYLYTYRTSNINTGSIYLYNPTNIRLYIDNSAGSPSGSAINYGLWFHICQTWSHNGGTYRYYKDATLRLAGTNLRTNFEIQGGGTFIIGQWQASIGGGFSSSYGINAEITKFNMWSKVLEESEIEKMFLEPCGHICGDVVWWSFFRQDDVANIEVEEHGLQCEEEERVCDKGEFTGKTWSFDSSAEFTYVTAPEDFHDIWKFTACWWMRTDDASGAARAMFSYFVPGDSYGSIVAENAKSLRAMIKNGWASPSKVSVTYGLWHHVCMTWNSDGGHHEWYKDGSRVFTQSNLMANQLLKGGGKIVFGQRQTSSGTYNRAYSYIGEIADFHMWEDVLFSSKIKDMAADRGCENGCGDLVAWSDMGQKDLEEVDVNEDKRLSGCSPRDAKCGSGEYANKIWKLDSSTDFSHAYFSEPIPELEALTACWWMRTKQTSTSSYMFTYRTSNVYQGYLAVYNVAAPQMSVNNQWGTKSGTNVNTGRWHHFCVTWDNAEGRYQYIKDTSVTYETVNLKKGLVVAGGGTLIIGHYQGNVGGDMNKVYGYMGDMTKFNIWSKVLDTEELQSVAATGCGNGCGDIVWWSFFRDDDLSSIEVDDFDVECAQRVESCKAGEYYNDTLVFDSTDEMSYAVVPMVLPDMDKITMCWWMKPATSRYPQYNNPISYRTYSDSLGSIYIRNNNAMRLTVNGNGHTDSKIAAPAGMWSHICASWNSNGGAVRMYRNGGLSHSVVNIHSGKTILGEGSFILGSTQTNVGGGLVQTYAYYGSLTQFNMWSEVLDNDAVEKMAVSGCVKDCGDLIWWSYLREDDLTNTAVEAYEGDKEINGEEERTIVCEDVSDDCTQGEFVGKALTFTRDSEITYATVFKNIPEMKKLTACWWMRSSDTAASYIFTYFTNKRALEAYNPNNLQLLVEGSFASASGRMYSTGVWHHACMTWNNNGGTYQYFKDGKKLMSKINFHSGKTIQGGGSFVLGQYQGSAGGIYSKNYNYKGDISLFNIWSSVLEDEDIASYALDGCSPMCGEIVSWSDFTSRGLKDVEVNQASAPCGPELPVCYGGDFDGKKWSMKSTTSSYNYAKPAKQFPDIWEFSICMWAKTEYTGTSSAFLTYLAKGRNYAILIMNPANVVMYVNQAGATASGLKVNYGKWTHLCFTWNSDGGVYKYYHDGNMMKSGVNLQVNKEIIGGGELIIGGRKNTLNGNPLGVGYYFDGEMTNFNMWKTIIDDDKIHQMSETGCQNSCGDLISWASITEDEVFGLEVEESELECRYEPQCAGGAFENNTMTFDSTNRWSYALMSSKQVPEMKEFTMCWWMKTTDTVGHRRTPVSYFAPGANYYGSIVVEYPINLRLWVNGAAGAHSGMKVNYGLWHHVCFTWNSNGGSYKAYKDGRLRYSNINLRSSQTVKGNGILVLGQRQTTYAGGFYKHWAYYGDMANFNMWSEALDGDRIQSMAVAPCDQVCGDVIMWSDFTNSDAVNIETEEIDHEEDLPCSPELPVCHGGAFEDKTWKFDSTYEFTYAKVEQRIPDLDELTICFWMKTNDETNAARSLVSYRAFGDSYGSIVLEYVHNMRMWINNQNSAFSGMEVNYGLWHHVCVTWTQKDGVYKFFKDGVMKYSNVNLAKDKLIRGGGEMIIGQRQTTLGGGFSRSQSYIGKMDSFNVWSNIIDDDVIQELVADPCLTGCGNLVSWSSFTSDNLEEIDVEDQDRECPARDRCYGGTFKRRTWNLDNSVDWSYGSSPSVIPDMDAFTVCFWVKMPDTGIASWGTLFSYFTDGDRFGSIVMTYPTNLRMWVKNWWASPWTKFKVETGAWQRLCMTWTSSDGGAYKLYNKGEVVYAGSGLASGQTIKGGGSLVVGQKLMNEAGGFHKHYSLKQARILNFNMWDNVLSKSDIADDKKVCRGGCGNVISWHEFTFANVENIATTKIRCRTKPGGEIDIEDQKEDDMTTVSSVETTAAPTQAPTQAPTEAPTKAPTAAPTVAPTEAKTVAPTEAKTEAPTAAPTAAPTEAKTEAKTEAPTEAKTEAKTEAPKVTTLAPIVTTECPLPEDLPMDAAVGKTATQSSRKGGSKADRAVDGDKNSNLKTGKSCSKTNVEANPWWKVDLGESMDIYKVTITNRQDCCAEALLNAEVRVGDSENIAENAVCGVKVSQDVVGQETIDVVCDCGNPLIGRYVSVQLVGVTESLTLCEVSVGGLPLPTLAPEFTTEYCTVPDDLENVARDKKATQSSNKSGGKASRAVDGNKNTDYKKGKSCTHTKPELHPWWRVDLGENFDVYKVTITNRQDCCAERLIGAQIRVGNSEKFEENDPCGHTLTEHHALQETVEVICACGTPLHGQYVMIQLTGSVKESLVLCEVEVGGIRPEVATTKACVVPDGLTNIATGAVVSQSTTTGKAVADRAVDGDKNSAFKGRSCSKTQVESEPWWKVDLGSSQDVYQVTITNRHDCCGERLLNAEVRIGDSENIKENAVCGFKVDEHNAVQETIDIICACGEAVKGRYVSVQLAGTTQALTLCEVDVLAVGGPTVAPHWTTVKEVTPTLEPATTTSEPCILPEGLVNIITPEVAVEQSSTRAGRQATRAVDGNKDSNLKTGGSCTMTNKEYEPWFKMDLGASKPIYEVVMTNRMDCCSFRLRFAEIRVGDSPNPRENPICSQVLRRGRTVRKETVRVTCGCEEPLTGRYISIQLFNRTNMLTLCEVEAMSWPEAGCEVPNNVVNLINSATTVTQSSIKRGLGADKAIDGDKNSDIAGKSCTQTKEESNPWWKADLGETRSIFKVVVTNRMDCCSWRLDDAEIRIGDNPDHTKNALCGTTLSREMVREETIEVTCDCPNALQGRYVSVNLTGDKRMLTLCEVEILGIR